MTEEIPFWPVIVAGGGPTGLTTANLLARYGVRVLLIERNPTTVSEPRAVSIDDESLRTMQAAGVVETILPTLVLGYGSDYFSASGKCFLRVHPTTREYGFPRRNAFRQPVLEAQLREHLAMQPAAETWFGCELIGFEQTAEQVLLQVRRADGSTAQVACSYLAACDGGRSFVRDKLGIKMSGSTFRERWLIIDLDATKETGRDTKVFCNPDRPCIALPGPNGTRRFEFMLKDGETDEEILRAEKVSQLLRLYSDDDGCPVRRKVVYTFHARMAERWSSGRIFLAGDAAHLTPPFAGQGMNSGVRDATNLAWKLAAVVKGQLGPKLLQTYEQERRDHAWQLILLAIRMGRVMMPHSRLAAAATQTAFRLLRLFPPALDYFAQMKYKPKPRFHHGFLAPASGMAGDFVGRLFPQPMVRIGDGDVPLDEILGDGFALVSVPGTDPEAFALLPDKFLDELKPKRIYLAIPGRKPASLPIGVIAAEAREDLMRRIAGVPPGLLLFRPDRYIAAFLSSKNLEESANAVQEMSKRTRA